MTTIHFASLTVAITLVGLDGLPKATPAIRPLRKTPTGFGVVFHGKVLPVTPTSANTGTAKLTDARLDPATCPVAKKSDLALATSQPKAEPVAAAFAKAPEAEPAKKPRTIAQLRATATMCAANLAKATAEGDQTKIAAALKATQTADAKVAEAQKPAAKPAKARKGTKASVTVEQAPAATLPTKAELMAQIEALTKLLAAAK